MTLPTGRNRKRVFSCMRFYKAFLIAVLLMLSAGRLFATHFYGVDLYYKHIAGNTYRVSIVAYGDCSGTQFPSFSVNKPQIQIFKGNAEFLTDLLDHEPPQEGIEVTPVCPAELANTTCVNPAGSVPGVKKFVYSKEFTLSGPAPDWKFVFKGYTDGTTIAGRSNSLTNVSPPGIIRLEATLDNTQHNNSSPEYTTIATPFYCISRPVNFNPGAVDADGDSLVYELVDGLDTVGLVTYIPPYTGSNPIAVATGAFKFSKSTGQLNFTPNITQKSLVVYRVSEYRKGVLLGTSMREMTVVIMPCNNNPPVGYVSNAAGATIADTVTVQTCKGSHELAFDINPTDADNAIINMVANGLPAGSTLNITNNNSKNPTSRFTWNMPELPDGNYTFFVTYTDDGCPIASKQTQAYTIHIAPDHIFAEAIAADCGEKGFIKVTALPSWVPWTYQVLLEPELVFSGGSSTTTAKTDSLTPAKYKVKAINYFGCTADTVIEIPFNCEIADIPTAFSPNGDGYNDTLLVRGVNIAQMNLAVYNRWGELVFQSHEVNKGWNGGYKGADAPLEVYGYVLSVVFKSGNTFHKKGNITLIR